MDNFKCMSAHICDDLNKNDTFVSIDLIDACETLYKELSKSMKIAKKFKEELKLANFEKEELIVRLDESNKKNKFLRNQFSSQDEKMKSLEQELAESKAKLKILTWTKPVIDDRSVSIPIKSKDKIYIPPFKRNHKENAYFARLDKGKSFDIDAEVSKCKSKNTGQLTRPDLQPDWLEPVFNPLKMTHFLPSTQLTRLKLDLTRPFAISTWQLRWLFYALVLL